jgi:hypothetical protein
LRDLVSVVEQLLPELCERQHFDALASDVFEAGDDLLGLGRYLLAGDTRVNYPVRVSQERELWRALRVVLRNRPPEDIARYQRIFDVAEQILSIAQDVRPSIEGHLGFLATARGQFAFLQTDFGFAVVSEEPVRIRFSSGDVYLELSWAKNVSSSCSFGRESNPSMSFWIDDLLFLHGDERYRFLPEKLVLDTPNAVEQWFGFLAGIVRDYGQDVWRNRRGIFDELAAAQAAKDREYAQENERRSRVGPEMT